MTISFTKRLFLLPFLLLVACAKPTYVQVQNGNPSSPNQEKLAADCQPRFKDNGGCLIWWWEKMPTSQDLGQLVFKIVRANRLDQTAIPVPLDVDPLVILWMPSMGHGSTPTRVERIDSGSYRVHDVFFIMPGEWQIQFQIPNVQGQIDEVIVPVTI